MAVEIPAHLLFPLVLFTIVVLISIVTILKFFWSKRDIFVYWLLGWLSTFLVTPIGIVFVTEIVNVSYVFGATGLALGFTVVLKGVMIEKKWRFRNAYYVLSVALPVIIFAISFYLQLPTVVFLSPILYYTAVVSAICIHYLYTSAKNMGPARYILIASLGGWLLSSFLFPMIVLDFELLTHLMIVIHSASMIIFGGTLFVYTVRRYARDLKLQYDLSELMSSIIRHDIRNYLQAAMQSLDLVRSDSESSGIWLSAAEESLHYATEFVNSMRTLSSEIRRIDSEPNLEAINVRDVIYDVLHVVHRSHSLKNTKLNVEIPDDLFVLSHRLVRQMFVNIVDNFQIDLMDLFI